MALGHHDVSQLTLRMSGLEGTLLVRNQRHRTWRQPPKAVWLGWRNWESSKPSPGFSWYVRKWKQTQQQQKRGLLAARPRCSQWNTDKTHKTETMCYKDPLRFCLQQDRKETTLNLKMWLNIPCFQLTRSDCCSCTSASSSSACWNVIDYIKQ